MKKLHYLTGALLLALLMTACDELPPDEDDLSNSVFLSTFLEPGGSGWQHIYLTHQVTDGTPLDLANTCVPNAEIILNNETSGESVVAQLHPTDFYYRFLRDSLVLDPHDLITLEVSGNWDQQTFSGEASTRVVSPESFAWTIDPPADTTMLHDETLEEGLNDPTAFYLNWEHLEDSLSYRYVIRCNSEVYDPVDGWIDTPDERLYWLRADEELAWQWDTSPCLITVPSMWTGSDMRLSWGAFVYVDAENDTLINGHSRKQGYYRVEVLRMNEDAYNYHFSVHQWIRMFEWDPIDFNLNGDGVEGIVASWCRQGFMVQIVDGWGDD